MAIEVVGANRGEDGRWPLQNVFEGASHLELDDGEGHPSRWNTLRAMRVLDWFAPQDETADALDRVNAEVGEGTDPFVSMANRQTLASTEW